MNRSFVTICVVLSCLCLLSVSEQDKSSHKHGKPLNTVYLKSKDNAMTIDYDVIDQLLTQPEVKDRKIVVVTIVGDQKDKSFFLDYCVRFMYANVS